MPPPPSPTVFVIDDDAAVRKAVSRLLRSAGIAVAVFASPREFLAQYDPGTPGCLVLDIAMPGFNGLQLQTALGKKGSSLPIIFLTGHGDVSKSVRAMKGGAFDFLTKPVNAKNLLPAIRAAIEKMLSPVENRPSFPKSARVSTRSHRASGKCSNMSSLAS